jgi:beta-glucanase (GH16 family)
MTILNILIAASLAAGSCGKDGGGGNAGTAPSNLQVAAVVAADNSGNVNFTATATNATSFDYDFGNGVYQTVASGIITYRYPASGVYTVKVTAKNASNLTTNKSISVTVNVAQALVWSDEFNTPGAPDPGKWTYDIGTGSGGWGNNELQYYTDRAQNVIIQNGVLRINAIKENYNGSTWTSARIKTQGKYSFKYGKVEVSAKFPTGVGTWPAGWALGNDIQTVGWPACGEIDIVEHLGRELNKIYATLHYPGRSGSNADGNTRIISNATSEFHKYTLEWSASVIKISVDDQLVHSVTNSSAIPFNHDFFLIFNLAMGGNFGGNVDPALTNATYEVDYIRVYQ